MAVVVGVALGHFVAPDAGMNADPANFDPKAVQIHTGAPHVTIQSFQLNMISDTVAGIAVAFVLDRLISEARATISSFGSSVATIFVAWWQGLPDLERARALLDERRVLGIQGAIA